MTDTQLDVERFRKVRTLITRGSTKGEKTAARTRALAMAEAAGLTFEAACLQADKTKDRQSVATPSSSASPADAMASAFDKIFNTPEARAERAAREVKRQAWCRELLIEFGSEDAVFADTPHEIALRQACKPIVVKRPIIGGFTDTLAGWDGGPDMPAIVRETVTAAFPMADTVAGMWAEYAAWEKLSDARYAFEPNWDDDIRLRARKWALESKLDTTPAVTLDDLRARFDWMQYTHDREFRRSLKCEATWLATVRDDVERLVKSAISVDLRSPVSATSAVQDGRHVDFPIPGNQTGPDAFSPVLAKTTSERRRAVMSMLDDARTASLPDREIARRVGVSPTTVGNLRRRVRQAGEGLGAAS